MKIPYEDRCKNTIRRLKTCTKFSGKSNLTNIDIVICAYHCIFATSRYFMQPFECILKIIENMRHIIFGGL